MCTPTAQPYDAVVLHDDAGIGDNDRLIRHCLTPVQVVSDGRHGLKLSPQAFKHKSSEAGSSVDLECLLLEANKDARFNLGAIPHTYGLVAVSAADARRYANGAAWTPKAEDTSAIGAARAANPFHGDIVGPVTSSASRDLFAVAQIIVAIPADGLPYKPPVR